MPMEAFEFLSTSMARGAQSAIEFEKMRAIREDRKLKMEDRTRLLEAGKKTAEAIRKRPNIYRDSEAAANFAESGGDLANLPNMMKKEVTSGERVLASLTQATQKLLAQQMEEPDQEKKNALGTQIAINMAMAGRGQLFGADGSKTDFLKLLTNDAAAVVYDIANKETQKQYGFSEERSKNFNNLETFKQQNYLKNMYRESSVLSPEDQDLFASMAKAAYKLDPAGAAEVIKSGKISIPTRGADGVITSIKTVMPFQSIEDLLYVRSLGNNIDKLAVKAGYVTEDQLNIIKANYAAEDRIDNLPLTPSDVMKNLGVNKTVVKSVVAAVAGKNPLNVMSKERPPPPKTIRQTAEESSVVPTEAPEYSTQIRKRLKK